MPAHTSSLPSAGRDLARNPGAWLCLGALLVAVSMVLLRAQTYDVVIVNGRVLDPESNLDAVRSVGIRAGRLPPSPQND